MRRWREGQTIESWEAHKVAIQTILKLPTGELITGINSSLVIQLCTSNAFCSWFFWRLIQYLPEKRKKILVLFLFSFLLLFFNWYHFLNMVCHIIGSSDGTLKLWRGKTCLHTFVGHRGWSFYFYHAVFFLLLHYVVAKCLSQMFLRHSLVLHLFEFFFLYW